MPIYEYRCRSCRHRFELRQGYDDPPPASCPRCGGSVYKLYHPVPIIYKGSGFYSTDHRPTSGKSEETKEKDKESGEKAAAKEK